jgi:hypothetical protein
MEVVSCICKRNKIHSAYIQVSTLVVWTLILCFLIHCVPNTAEHNKIKNCTAILNTLKQSVKGLLVKLY